MFLFARTGASRLMATHSRRKNSALLLESLRMLDCRWIYRFTNRQSQIGILFSGEEDPRDVACLRCEKVDHPHRGSSESKVTASRTDDALRQPRPWLIFDVAR